jgi:hypothetical protein
VQIFNLLYRRIVFGKPWARITSREIVALGGLKIRDTAECNSALQQIE